jgi:hypothetical protein
MKVAKYITEDHENLLGSLDLSKRFPKSSYKKIISRKKR